MGGWGRIAVLASAAKHTPVSCTDGFAGAVPGVRTEAGALARRGEAASAPAAITVSRTRPVTYLIDSFTEHTNVYWKPALCRAHCRGWGPSSGRNRRSPSPRGDVLIGAGGVGAATVGRSHPESANTSSWVTALTPFPVKSSRGLPCPSQEVPATTWGRPRGALS